MAYKYSIYYAMVSEKEELDHRDRQVVFVFAIFYREHNQLSHLLSPKDSKPNSWHNFSLDVPLIAPVIATAALC